MEFLILPALIFFIYAVYGFSEKPQLAIVCTLLASLVNSWLFNKPLEIGISVLPHDVVFLPLFISAVYRVFFKRQLRLISLLWCFYGLLLFSQLAVGVKMLGTVAMADFRTCFYYWTGTFYFMSFNYSNEMIGRLIKYWYLMCVILLCIVYFRFAADLANLPIAQDWRTADTTGVRFRVVYAEYAYLLGVTVTILFYRYIQPSLDKPSKAIMALFVIAVIVLQHRTAWVSTGVAILSALFLPGIKSTKVFGKLGIIFVIGFILMLPVLYLGYADKIISSVFDSAEKATNLSTGTFGDRVKGWEHILDYWEHQSFLHQLFGDPFGTGYAGGDHAPHNFYFQALLRVGLLGAIALFFAYLLTVVKLYLITKDVKSNVYVTLFIMLLVGQQAFYIPYGQQAEHGIILGIAISLAKRGNVTTANRVEPNTRLGKAWLPPEKISLTLI
ncbi:O-antigen ligase family protein [Methylomonas sp. YC3]